MNGIELFKISKRKESWLLFAMILLPIMYSLGFSSGSPNFQYNGHELLSCMDWIQIMCSMISQIAIFYIFTSIVTARSIASEIEDGSIHLYIHRVNNRKKLYMSKFVSNCIYTTVAYLFFLLTSTLCYFVILKNAPLISSSTFLNNRTATVCIFASIEVYISFIFMISLGMVLGVVFKPLISIAISIIVHIASILISQMSLVCFLSPWFYFNKMLDNLSTNTEQLGNPKLHFFTCSNTVLFVFYFLVEGIYIMTMLYVGRRRFESIDI